jgi:RNA polymerase sigma-70 factor (ECF subfamily)
VSAQSLSVELTAAPAGGRVISELEDVNALVQRYKARLFRFVLLSISDRDAAETIIQDCFLKAYSTRAQFRGECSVSTWLMRIAFNLVRDHTKSQKFRFWKKAAASAIDASDVSHYLPSSASSPEAQLIAKERVKMVHEALQKLPGKQRSVFLMRFVEDMDLLDIATVTGMTTPTVKTHLYRAVAAIRLRLGAPR